MVKYPSKGLETFFEKLHYRSRRPKIVLPDGFKNDYIQSNDYTSIKDWFVNKVDNDLGGKVEECAIEDNMATFIEIKKRDKQIDYISIQALIAERDLTYFYLNVVPVIYMRLDYTNPIDDFFKEQLPHIHTHPVGPPRLSCPHPLDVNPISSFFDFIYRNFYYDKWFSWLKSVCVDNVIKRDVFDELLVAYKIGGKRLEDMNYELNTIRRTWKKELNDMCKIDFDNKRRLYTHIDVDMESMMQVP